MQNGEKPPKKTRKNAKRRKITERRINAASKGVITQKGVIKRIERYNAFLKDTITLFQKAE